jgi:2-C-methyl-D-erythritol 4-phosphate cytidylyltransferase
MCDQVAGCDPSRTLKCLQNHSEKQHEVQFTVTNQQHTKNIHIPQKFACDSLMLKGHAK